MTDNYLFAKAVDYPNLSYKDVISEILHHGQEVSPRGQKTWELQPYIHKINNPLKSLCSVPGRKANPFFNMAENMWILGGHGDSEWICSFNNKLLEFQGDEGHSDFNAPYGRRIRFYNKHREGITKATPYTNHDVSKMPKIDQLLHCYESIKKDAFTRQAVVTLWNPVLDYHLNITKDRPCNTTIYFKVRDGKLNMTVSNRSNDVHLGLYGVNFVQFSCIQMFLKAGFPDMLTGHYVHISDSLHIYANSEHTKRVLESQYFFDVYEYVDPFELTNQYMKKYYETKYNEKDKDIGISEIMIIPDKIISENVKSRQENSLDRYYFCGSDYEKACALYLHVYDNHKKKQYSRTLEHLSTVSDAGLKDYVICGLEFLCRNEAFTNTFSKDMIEDFLVKSSLKLDTQAKNSVLRYLYGH